MAKQKKSKYLESFADPKALFESFIIPLINIETEEEAAQFVIDTIVNANGQDILLADNINSFAINNVVRNYISIFNGIFLLNTVDEKAQDEVFRAQNILPVVHGQKYSRHDLLCDIAGHLRILNLIELAPNHDELNLLKLTDDCVESLEPERYLEKFLARALYEVMREFSPYKSEIRKLIGICAKCKRFFFKSRKDKEYCSDACSGNARATKYYKDKIANKGK